MIELREVLIDEPIGPEELCRIDLDAKTFTMSRQTHPVDREIIRGMLTPHDCVVLRERPSLLSICRPPTP
jgi:hypothetical protein